MLLINFFSKYQSFENKGATLAVSFILIVVMSLKKSDDGYTEYYKQLLHMLGIKQ